MRRVVGEPRYVAHELLVHAVLELHELAEAGVDADVREQKPHEVRVDAHAVGFGDLEQGEPRLVEELGALAIELFVVRNVLDGAEALHEVLVGMGVGNESLLMGAVGVFLHALRDVFVHELARRRCKLRVRRQIHALQVCRDVGPRFHQFSPPPPTPRAPCGARWRFADS